MATRTVLIGAGAGLVAAYAMERAQAALSKAHEASGDKLGPSGDAPATENAADLVTKLASGRPVPEPQKAKAGRLVHYATGATLGVVYATAAASRLRGFTAGFGLLYGLVVSLVLDEGLVPALRLSPPPTETSVTGHMDGLAAHAVFGVTLEATRLALDKMLP